MDDPWTAPADEYLDAIEEEWLELATYLYG